MNLNNDPVNKTKNIMRWVMLAGIGALAFFFWGTIAAFVAETLKNTLLTVVYGGILTAVGLFAWQYPQFIAQTYTNICRHITGFFIKMDFLSYMDRYTEYLLVKLQNLQKSLVTLKGKREKLNRKIVEIAGKIKEDLRLGTAAKSLNKSTEASFYGMQVRGNQQSLQLFTPMRDRMDRYIHFMEQLYENWTFSRKSLLAEIDRKRTEYEVVKEASKGLKSVEDMMNSGSEEARMFAESMKALEESVTQKIAYIENFEKESQGLLSNMSIEKQANQTEGLEILERYMNDSKLFMPDFSNADIQDLDYVAIKTGQENQAFKFLK